MVKYYYNGVLLPEVPIVEGYPYYFIQQDNATPCYNVVYSKVGFFYYANGNGTYIRSKDNENCRSYALPLDGNGDWTYFNASWIDWGSNSTYYVFYSNSDISNGSATSTTIYFYGTEPVPESGTEPDEPDSSEIKKYLIRSQNVLYTISDGTLTALESAELSVDVFGTHGFDELPDWSVISSLVNPEIMYCQSDIEEELPTITATMNAIPFPQTIVSPNYNMTDDTILGVECAYVTASSDVVFAISVDDGVTWYMWTGQAWGILTDTMTGMTAETINAITTEQWAGLTPTGQLKVRMTLFDENSSFTSFVMDYIN